MAVTDWDWRHPVELQDVPWDCAAASTAWALQAAGLPYSEAQVVAGLGPARISPGLGLLDASGAGLVEWLAEIGVTAESNPAATWADITAAAGHQPMVMGGRAWCHWTGVRIWGGLYVGSLSPYVAIANPAPGYQDVWQVMDAASFSALGPFSAVWLTSW
jgi:hypothetical protein